MEMRTTASRVDHDAPPPPIPEHAQPFHGAKRATLWTCLAWVLVVIGFDEAGGLIFGPKHYFSSQTYSAIRAIGIRPVGIVLGVFTIALVVVLARGLPRATAFLCVVGQVYWLFWTFAILLSWWSHGVVAWTAPVAPLLFAFLFFLLVTRIDERRVQ